MSKWLGIAFQTAYDKEHDLASAERKKRFILTEFVFFLAGCLAYPVLFISLDHRFNENPFSIEKKATIRNASNKFQNELTESILRNKWQNEMR